MQDSSEWKNLTTINYPHGYHGDFIACLIMGVNPQLSEGLTATYTTPGVTSAFGVKNLDVIVGMHVNQKCRDWFASQDTEFAKRQRAYFSQIDGDDFKENLKEDLRWQLRAGREIKTVFNTHYTNYHDFLPLQEIFPGSKNVFLTIENPRNKSLYDFLFEYKILKHYRNTSAYGFYREILMDVPHRGEKPIYVDVLMSEIGFSYASEVEAILDCKFDRDLLSLYKELNEALLAENGHLYDTVNHRKTDAAA